MGLGLGLGLDQCRVAAREARLGHWGGDGGGNVVCACEEKE